MGASAKFRLSAAAAILLLAAAPAAAASDDRREPDFGRPATAADLAGMVSIPPSGAGLPPGHGTAAEGQQVWTGQCAMCHGDKLQGIKATGAPALASGRGTLTVVKPVKTVESYWPYATTLFDYVRRAMLFNAPGSLTDEQVMPSSRYPGDRLRDRGGPADGRGEPAEGAHAQRRRLHP